MRLILLLVLSFSMWSCANNGEEEVIVVSRGYKGYILIIFNQKDGTAPRYEGRKRVYEIPANGILKTQFTGNYGWRGFTEFYYKKITPDNKLSSFAEFEKIPPDTIVGFIGANGTVKKNSESEERLEFVQFFIGTKAEIEQAQEAIQKLDIVKLAE